MDSNYRIREDVYRNGESRFFIEHKYPNGWVVIKGYGHTLTLDKAKELLKSIREYEVIEVKHYT